MAPAKHTQVNKLLRKTRLDRKRLHLQQKKQKRRPKEIVTQKMLMEAISDPESPIMKALTYALITPLRAAIREEMKTHKESIGKLTEEISSLKTELTEKNNYIANLESRVDD